MSVKTFKSDLGGFYRAKTEREAAGKVLQRCARLMKAAVHRMPARDSLGFWTGECSSERGITIHSFRVEVTLEVPPGLAPWERRRGFSKRVNRYRSGKATAARAAQVVGKGVA